MYRENIRDEHKKKEAFPWRKDFSKSEDNLLDIYIPLNKGEKVLE